MRLATASVCRAAACARLYTVRLRIGTAGTCFIAVCVRLVTMHKRYAMSALTSKLCSRATCPGAWVRFFNRSTLAVVCLFQDCLLVTYFNRNLSFEYNAYREIGLGLDESS